MYEMLSLLKNNPLSPVFRCEELKKINKIKKKLVVEQKVVEIKTEKNDL